jgi:hypothetical protein
LLPDEAAPAEDATIMRIDVTRFVERLNPQFLQACEILLAGNISEGAREAGVHRWTVHQRVRLLREHAVARGLDIYCAPNTSLTSPVCDPDEPGVPLPGSNLDRDGASRMIAGRRLSNGLSITVADLCRWISEASSGDSLEYHRGFLMIDTNPLVSRLPEMERAELCRVAQRARQAVDNGLTHLVQRRHGPHDFAYLIIARSHPPGLPIAPACSHPKTGGTS